MKKTIALISLLFFASACHTFKHTSERYERLPLKITNDTTKEGKACHDTYFPFSYLYSNGDISVETARKNGDIKEITSIETEYNRVLFYDRKCTVVKGN